MDGHCHLVAYASQSVTTHESNYHSMKLEFPALKWVIAMQFQEYLLWKLFVFKTDNIPLTYIMTTLNLDATWHCWRKLLSRFTFSIEYQKGKDSTAVDALSHVTSKLNAVTMKSILDGVTIGLTDRVDAHHLAVADADEEIYKQVQVCVDLQVTNWLTAQQGDSMLKALIEWISHGKVQDLKHLLGKDVNTKEGKTILREKNKLTLYQGALYHCHMPTGKLREVLQFIFPKPHQKAAMNGCH